VPSDIPSRVSSGGKVDLDEAALRGDKNMAQEDWIGYDSDPPGRM
jgi:hypothetical protein